MVLHTRGPVLGGNRKRRGQLLSVQWLLTVGLVVGGGWLWIDVIGRDLDSGYHLNASHKSEAEAAAQAPVPAVVPSAQGPLAAAGTPARLASPGGPAQPHLPGPRPDAASVDPVAKALLATARDHLARKVVPTVHPVDDPRANKGNHFDVIDRGLADFVPLRTALVRHRWREPHVYGLATRPPATTDERRRALTADNLVRFLGAFAERVELVAGQDALEPGDVVFVERRRGARRLMAAVVSDTVDEQHRPQIVTLDPADRAPREQSPEPLYLVRHHFRLRAAHVERMRASLDLGPAPQPGTAM